VHCARKQPHWAHGSTLNFAQAATLTDHIQQLITPAARAAGLFQRDGHLGQERVQHRRRIHETRAHMNGLVIDLHPINILQGLGGPRGNPATNPTRNRKRPGTRRWQLLQTRLKRFKTRLNLA